MSEYLYLLMTRNLSFGKKFHQIFADDGAHGAIIIIPMTLKNLLENHSSHFNKTMHAITVNDRSLK